MEAVKLASKAAGIFNADTESEDSFDEDPDFANQQRRTIAEDYINEHVDMLVAKNRLRPEIALEMKDKTPEALESAYSLLKLERMDSGDEEKPDLSDVRQPPPHVTPTPPPAPRRKKSPARKK